MTTQKLPLILRDGYTAVSTYRIPNLWNLLRLIHLGCKSVVTTALALELCTLSRTQLKNI